MATKVNIYAQMMAHLQLHGGTTTFADCQFHCPSYIIGSHHFNYYLRASICKFRMGRHGNFKWTKCCLSISETTALPTQTP